MVHLIFRTSGTSEKRTPDMKAPRLEANCTAHGTPLVMCDHCANIHFMALWTSSLSGDELAAALEQLNWSRSWYAPAEQQAIVAEAARRVRSPGPRTVPGMCAAGDHRLCLIPDPGTGCPGFIPPGDTISFKRGGPEIPAVLESVAPDGLWVRESGITQKITWDQVTSHP